MILLDKKNFLYKLLTFFVYFYPIFIILGPSVINFFAILAIIIFIFLENKFLIYQIKKKYLISFFFLILIFSSIFSDNFFSSLKSSINILIYGIVCFVIFFLILNKKINLNIFLGTLYLLFFFLILDSHLQFLSGKNILGFELHISEFVRTSSFFQDELILGSYLFKIFPIFLCLLFFQKKYNSIILFLPLIFSSIILSGERVAFALFTFLILSILFFAKFQLKKKIIIFLTLLLVFVFHFQFNKYFKYNIIDRSKGEVEFSLNNKKNTSDSIVNTNKYSLPFVVFTNSHTQIFNNAISIFMHNNKIIGIGPNNFRNHCHIYDKRWCTTHPHNFLIQLLLETGIVGLLFYVLIYFFFVKEMIINIFKVGIKYQVEKTVLLSLILINFFPLFPSGNFFSSYYLSMLYYPIGFYLYFKYS